MKHIILGRLLYRVLAKLIDFTIVISLTMILFFSVILNNTFDRNTYISNQNQIASLCEDSGLYILTNEGNAYPLSEFSNISSINALTNVNVNIDKQDFNNINVTKRLYEFYTIKYSSYTNQNNLSKENFKKMVLRTNEEISNIKDVIIDEDNNIFSYVLIDETKGINTVNFVNNALLEACKKVESSNKVSSIIEANRKLIVNTLIYIIPLFTLFSLIFDLLVPLFNKNNASIGKMIFKLGIISKDGYKLNKGYVVFRWLGIIFFDFFLSICTVGGALIISYTMALFNKNRRVLHDYFGNSVVINVSESLYFASAKEERYIMENKRSSNLL